jgi:hypothetical protein
MLNEFSDKAPESKRKPFLMSGEFWLGFVSFIICLTLTIGFLA